MNYKDGRTSKKYYCIDCGKKITYNSVKYGSGLCESCCRKGSRNHMFGKLNTGSSKWMKKNNPMKRPEIKAKSSITMSDGRRKGPNNPMFGKKRPAQSIRMKGKNNPIFITPSYGNGDYYKNTWMRSSWEILFAQFLDLSNVKWLYESKTFDLGNTTYTPDFYMPEFDCYIEIKGYWRDDAKKKFKRFKKEYSNTNIKVFNQKKLNQIGVLL